MSSFSDDKEGIRQKVIGLGERSFSKSYYPQLQDHITELEHQKRILEAKTQELNQTILDLKETKLRLEVSEKRYRDIFENANDAIFIFNSSNQCIECNSKGLELMEFENHQDAIAQNPFKMTPTFQPNGQLSYNFGRVKLLAAWNGKPQFFNWVIKNHKNNRVYCEVSLNRITIGETYILQAIVRDVTQFKQLEHDISMATIRTEEKERQRFSKEIHDGIGPILSTIKLYVQWLGDTDNEEHIDIIKTKINKSINEATKAIKEVSQNLSPHVLSNYGLIEALHKFINRIRETGKLEIKLNHNLTCRLNSDYEMMFYRATTELINNTIKHADATIVNIDIQLHNSMIYFTYQDNGIGLNQTEAHNNTNGMGLNNIKNRVKSLGGHIRLNNNKHHGFYMQIIITPSPTNSIKTNN